MSENRFRNSLFGGFNRHDVVGYIERSSLESVSMRTENEKLLDETEELRLRLSELEDIIPERDELKSRLETADGELNTLRAEAEAKDLELEQLRARLSSAEDTLLVYEQTKLRLSQLELDAARRAVEIEKEAAEQADLVAKRCTDIVNEMRGSYESVCRDANATAAHIRGEMAKLSDRLTQLTGILNDSSVCFDKLDDILKEGRTRLGTKDI